MKIKLEELALTSPFLNQLENKILYSNHKKDVSVSYKSTYTIKHVIEGVKYYNYNNQDIKVSKNQYLILNNGSNITSEAKSGTRGLSFFLSKKLMNEVYHYETNANSSIQFLEVIQNTSNSNISNLLNKIAYLYEHNPFFLKQQMDDLFINISELIIQQQIAIDNNFNSLKIVKHNTKQELYKLVTQAKEYLDDNISKDISLDTISKDIGISKYYLHRLFTEINGYTPNNYLTNIRIAKAKDKLRYSKDSIFEIAITCGFDNISYFSNTFKKYVGYSPSQFRKKI